MKEYLDLLNRVYKNGVVTKNRTGIDTISTFIENIKIDISESFPLLTTKKIHFKSVVYEMLWFLKNESNIKFLTENGVRIWNEWADEKGDLGLIYGNMWREFPAATSSRNKEYSNSLPTDQIKEVIKQIKENPNSRRHIVTTWHPGLINDFALPPCHVLFQFLVRDKEISCNLYMRENLCAF